MKIPERLMGVKQLLVILLMSGLVLTACAANPGGRDGASSEIPVITGINQDLDIAWESAKPPVGVRDQIIDALASRAVSTLLPTNAFDDTSETSGRFTIVETTPTGIVTAQVVTEGPDWILSIGSTAVSDADIGCDDRISSGLESGVAWDSSDVRSVGGCAAVNEVGLIFLEWEDAGHHFHVEGRMQLSRAIEWLDTWELVP